MTQQLEPTSKRSMTELPEGVRGLTQAAIDVLDAMSDPVSVLDDAWTITFINAAGAAVMERRREELIGKNLWELVPHIVGTPLHEAYQRARRDRTAVQLEEHYAPLDRWFEVRVYPVANGLAVHTHDVTARKRHAEIEGRLARHATLLADVSVALSAHRDIRSILQQCCEAMVHRLHVSFARIWTVDEAGKSLELQASAGRYTHIDGPHRLVPIGKFKIGLIAEERKPHLTNDVLNDPRVGNHEWARAEGMVAFAGYPLMVDDRVVGVMAMFAQQPLPDDTLAALSGIADSLSQGIERRRAELQLQERVRDLARSNADLEQFAYVASHDLQEPLRMVTSYIQLLARRYKGKLDTDADEFITFAVEGVGRMQQLINDLLAYSRLSTRGHELSVVSMDKVADKVLANLAKTIEDEQASVTRQPLPDVLGDEGQLIQLLQNLVSNSLKFHGDAKPVVRVSAKAAEGEVVFTVEDEGIGIEPKYFERIFVIFQRLHSREKYPGTGIGLAICKKIVERHRGRIWVESHPDGGSRISFALPSATRARRSST